MSNKHPAFPPRKKTVPRTEGYMSPTHPGLHQLGEGAASRPMLSQSPDESEIAQMKMMEREANSLPFLNEKLNSLISTQQQHQVAINTIDTFISHARHYLFNQPGGKMRNEDQANEKNEALPSGIVNAAHILVDQAITQTTNHLDDLAQTAADLQDLFMELGVVFPKLANH